MVLIAGSNTATDMSKLLIYKESFFFFFFFLGCLERVECAVNFSMS